MTDARGLLAGIVFGFLGLFPATAKTITIEFLEGTINPATIENLGGLACRNLDHIVHLKIAVDWPAATLAEVTGASAFSLFRAFKKYRGYSPLEFAKQLRLRHAHELLRRPDAAISLAEIASACGFADLGHFVDDYIRAFGEYPSQTPSRT
jgi:AraC-like DNA-binding protein